MIEPQGEAGPATSAEVPELTKAVEISRRRGDLKVVDKWLERELDDRGAPIRLPLGRWKSAIEQLARVAPGGGWPSDARATDFVRMLQRFSRPDGRTASLGDEPQDLRSVHDFWRRVATAFPAPDVARVLGWWFPRWDVDPAPPPLPAWSSPDRVQAVLRADWTPRGDLLAVNQVEDRSSTRFELFGAGIPWLGPSWTCPGAPGSGAAGPARPTAWSTNSSVDVLEWSVRAGRRTATRLALMLRGRRIALLADVMDRPAAEGEDLGVRFSVPSGMLSGPPPAEGALVLLPGVPGRSAQAIPLAGDRLEFDADRREIVATPKAGGRWLPILISWDHTRHRKALEWEAVTVAEQGRISPASAAFAARVSWGRAETFVVYRSFTPPTRRSFLGCSTTSRFLFGRFTPEGDVEAIATLP